MACGVLRPDDDPDVRAGATTTARGVRARPRAGARARGAAGAAVPVLRGGRVGRLVRVELSVLPFLCCAAAMVLDLCSLFC